VELLVRVKHPAAQSHPASLQGSSSHPGLRFGAWLHFHWRCVFRRMLGIKQANAFHPRVSRPPWSPLPHTPLAPRTHHTPTPRIPGRAPCTPSSLQRPLPQEGTRAPLALSTALAMEKMFFPSRRLAEAGELPRGGYAARRLGVSVPAVSVSGRCWPPTKQADCSWRWR